MLPRGIGLATAGGALVVLGIGFASTPLTMIGGTTLLAAGLGAAWIVVRALATRATVEGVTRTVMPATLSVGSPADVTVRVSARGPLAGALRLREQAASELTGGGATRATVLRHRDGVELHYRLTPVKRGRWLLGPALARSTDPFGLAWADRSVGGMHEVAVWPAVVDLAGSAGELMGAASRARAGARTPATDDASLRDYREGDDLRRVHWASSARRGTLLVRSEEQQGRTAATILLALPPAPTALEWSVSAAASIALSVIEAGHPVRLVVDGEDTSVLDASGRAAEEGRARLLDATVDLAAPDSTAASDRGLERSAAQVDPGHRDVVIAVLEPCGRGALTALAPLGEGGRAWAIVRSSLAARARAERTVEGLRALGWSAVHSLEPESLETAWSRLLTETP